MASKRTQPKSSTGRAAKSGSTTRKSSGSRSSGSRSTSSRGTTTRKAAVIARRKPWLSPQQQRELFAFALISLGLLLMVLLGVDEPGVVGKGVVGFIQAAFGQSGIVLPLLFIVVGGLILVQERFVDAPISGGNVVGVVLLALVLMSVVEWSDTLDIYDDGLPAPTAIGGAIALGLMYAFGPYGGGVVLALLFVLSVMLTFNMTLRQIFGGLQAGAQSFWLMLWGEKVEFIDPDSELEPEPVPYAEELKAKRPPRPALNGGPKVAENRPALPAPPTDDELQRQMIFTPIAARPTQAGLFNRPESHGAVSGDGAKGEPLSAKRVALANAETQRIDVSQIKAETGAAPMPAAGSSSVASAPLSKAAQAKAEAANQDKETVDQEIAEIDASIPRQAWPVPSVTMLDNFSENEVDDNEKRSKARIIEDTLASFKIEAQVVGMNPGPAVTQYQLQPAVGVKVSRITGLEKDLALALAAPSIRLEAPIPGTSYIGIEIPNMSIGSVSMKEVLDTDEFSAHNGRLKLALGKDVSGTPVITDMAKAPHLLIAGSTGSGKSVAVNSIVCTLLMQYTPEDLKFIMVDPKMVELIVYNHIPHLLAPVVTELERVVSLLKWAVREMERRYKLLAQKGFRNIESYNKVAKKGGAGLEPLPYIVIIIDELADLMMMAPDEVETLVCRLAQMARAIGIHLILATQRPSVDVVTGLIKANFPTRMAFAVTSQIDSRVILDQTGAEQLLGRGDMLYLASDSPKPIRVQGTYVSDREIESLTRFWRAAQKPSEEPSAAPGKKPLPLKPIVREGQDGTEAAGAETAVVEPTLAVSPMAVSPLPDSHSGQLNAEEQDELLPKAIQLVRQHERASASLLQRRLRIGYSKAAQLIDMLEQRGVVGPAEGGRSREVLHDDLNDSGL